MNAAIEILECGHPESPHSNFTRGYGTDSDGNRHCYKCCAKHDREQMLKDKRATLYLNIHKPAKVSCGDFGTRVTVAEISNWPGSLKIPVYRMSTGRHNFAGIRYDVWFKYAGKQWHGVTYGEDTQLCHCKVVKS